MAAHVPRRLERDAQAGEGPLAQHFPVVTDIAAAYSDRAGLALRILVVPGAAEVGCEQAVVLRELRRRSRRTVAAQILGAGTDHAPIGSELARGEGGVRQGCDP